MTKVFTKSCLFIVCKTMSTIGESQAIAHAHRTADTRTPNCQSSQGQMEAILDNEPLNNIWEKLAVKKHVLLADEFIRCRPRLLGFHSLHVNAIKCIYVGFSLSKLLSFWKISLNSPLIRLEGFNNKISTNLLACFTWRSGKALARCVKDPEFISEHNFFSSLLLFSFLLFFLFLFV